MKFRYVFSFYYGICEIIGLNLFAYFFFLVVFFLVVFFAEPDFLRVVFLPLLLRGILRPDLTLRIIFSI